MQKASNEGNWLEMAFHYLIFADQNFKLINTSASPDTLTFIFPRRMRYFNFQLKEVFHDVNGQESAISLRGYTT